MRKGRQKIRTQERVGRKRGKKKRRKAKQEVREGTERSKTETRPVLALAITLFPAQRLRKIKSLLPVSWYLFTKTEVMPHIPLPFVFCYLCNPSSCSSSLGHF